MTPYDRALLQESGWVTRLPPLAKPIVTCLSLALLLGLTGLLVAAGPWNKHQHVGIRVPTPKVERLSGGTRVSIDCSKCHGHLLTHPNKVWAYQQLTSEQGRHVDDTVVATFYDIDKAQAARLPIPHDALTQVEMRDGLFRFDASDDQVQHWTADFADNQLFAYCEGGLLGQEGLLCIEHPALVHFKETLNHFGAKDYMFLRPGDRTTRHRVALIEGAKRYGQLSPLSTAFRRAKIEDLQAALESFDEPQESRIFAISAPQLDPEDEGETYGRDELEALLYRAYNAFWHIRAQAPEGVSVAVHTGNWGCGNFWGSPRASALMQLAAADLAGVDKIIYYPLGESEAFLAAKAIWERFKQEHPDATVADFISDVTLHAGSYDLVYGG